MMAHEVKPTIDCAVGQLCNLVYMTRDPNPDGDEGEIRPTGLYNKDLMVNYNNFNVRVNTNGKWIHRAGKAVKLTSC